MSTTRGRQVRVPDSRDGVVAVHWGVRASIYRHGEVVVGTPGRVVVWFFVCWFSSDGVGGIRNGSRVVT